MEAITDKIKYVGVYDQDIDLFESQYVAPKGITYNSYIIMDEKIVLFDTVDERATPEWLESLDLTLGDKKPDYIVVSHLEPDHSKNLKRVLKKYPDMKIIGNAMTFNLLPQFIDEEDMVGLENKKVVVKEGDIFNIGEGNLSFYMAPMVHWPEVMMTYYDVEKTLFSADAFGRFGSFDPQEEWVENARRFYINIVGKYGPQVQAILSKIAGLDIQRICSLHGAVLEDNLAFYIDKYNTWSKYETESEGILVLHASIHGNTAKAAELVNSKLQEKGVQTEIYDLTRCDMSQAIAKAFQYGKIILLASSYNMGVFPPMEEFLRLVKAKNIQNKKIAIVENGTWAPSAARTMKELLDGCTNISIMEPHVTIKSTLKPDTIEKLEELVENFVKQ